MGSLADHRNVEDSGGGRQVEICEELCLILGKGNCMEGDEK